MSTGLTHGASTPAPVPSGFLASSDISGWDLGFAAASIVAAWILSILAKKAVLALVRKMQGISEGAALLTARVVRYAILLVGIGVAFTFLGASIQPLIAIALIVGAVIVLALRGISNNFAAGLVLQTRHPITIGDEIEVDDFVGTVKELNGRSVVIVTRDGRTIHVPNAQLLESPLVNHSALGHRRSDIEVRVETSADQIDVITELVEHAAHAVDGVHERERVAIQLQTVEPKRIVMLVRFWHHPLKAPTIVSPVVRSVADALAGAGFIASVTSNIPAPPLTPPPDV